MNSFCWIPESPSHPGLYAWKNYPAKHFDDFGARKQNSTMDASQALQFNSREECQDWCNKNPDPVFTPVEHSFGC